MWSHVLFGGILRHKEIMGQSFVCALALDRERRDKNSFYFEVLAVCVKILTHEQGFSVSVTASGFDSVP